MALTQILTTDSVSASVVNAKIVGPANTALALTDTNLDNLETEVSSHLADIASQDDGKGADMVGLPDPNNLFNATNVGGAMQELFTNVSNGKDLVGGAITDVDDSVVIPTDPTFQQLANAIGGISTGKKWASGTVTSYRDSYVNCIDVSGLDFKPKIVWGWSIQFPGFCGAINDYSNAGDLNKAYYTDSSGNLIKMGLTSFDSKSSIFNGGFILAVSSDNRAGIVSWIAFE